VIEADKAAQDVGQLLSGSYHALFSLASYKISLCSCDDLELKEKDYNKDARWVLKTQRSENGI